MPKVRNRSSYQSQTNNQVSSRVVGIHINGTSQFVVRMQSNGKATEMSVLWNDPEPTYDEVHIFLERYFGGKFQELSGRYFMRKDSDKVNLHSITWEKNENRKFCLFKVSEILENPLFRFRIEQKNRTLGYRYFTLCSCKANVQAIENCLLQIRNYNFPQVKEIIHEFEFALVQAIYLACMKLYDELTVDDEMPSTSSPVLNQENHNDTSLNIIFNSQDNNLDKYENELSWF